MQKPIIRCRITILVATLMLVGAPVLPAQDTCYADCSSDLRGLGDVGPQAGDDAPPFSALLFDPATGSSQPVTLGSILQDRPVVLAFGSYT